MDYQLQDQTLIFHFEGDFDNVAVGKVKETCAALIETHRPKLVKLDFQKVDFVYSTGIGFVLARYKQIKKYDGELVLCNLSSSQKRLFHMSGIFRIIRLEQSEVLI